MRGETEMAIRSTVISARMRQYQVPAADAGCAEAGYELGRLWLAGRISARQLDAGKEYHRLVADYQQSIGLPSPYPQGIDLGAARGLSLKGEPDESRIRRTVNQYMHSLTAMDEAGKAASIAVREVCVYDRSGLDVDNLRRGLDILADFFGIPVDAARKSG